MSDAIPNSPVVAGKKKNYITDFDIIKTLGKGAFGDVIAAVEKSSGRSVAVKILSKKQIVRQKKTRYVKLERDILAKCRHAHVVQFIKTFSSPENLYYVLEMCPHGDLQNLLMEYGAFSLDAAIHCAAEVLEGLAYVHQQGVIHRDIKPENVMMGEGYHAKIGDFGTAKLFSVDGGGAAADDDDDPAERIRSATFVGSAAYMAPELLTSKETCPESDWYSFGSVVYQLLVGRAPYRDKSDYLIMERIKSADWAWPEDSQAPESARTLVSSLLAVDPDKRLGSRKLGGPDSVRQHPFFKDAVPDFTALHGMYPNPVSQFLSSATPVGSSTQEI